MRAKTNRKTMTTWTTFILAISACLLLTAPVTAQDSGPSEGHKGYQEYQYKQEQNTDFSKKELEKFALAFNDITEIRTEYSQVISEVKDAEEAQELQSQYTEKMIESIEEKGLDVEIYNEISMAMQQNPEVREKVRKMTR